MSFFFSLKIFSLSIYDKNHELHNINKTILGGILLFFGFGGVVTWGNLNIYFFSYFKDRANLSSPAQNNLILPILALPLAFITVFSIQIAEKFGFKKIIRISAFVYALSTFFSGLTENFYIFTLLYNFIPGLAVGFSLNPAIYCVWSYHPEIKGKISGYMFGVFQFSTLAYILIATMIINPTNKPATLRITDENNNEFNYYDSEITKNVPKMVLTLGIVYFCFCSIGSFLINEPIKKKENAIKEIKELEPVHLEITAQHNSKYEVFIEEKNKNLNESNEETTTNVKPNQEDNECPNVKSGIMTRTFLILFFNTGLVASFALYLNINFKTFSLTRLNNDYYVTFLYVFNGISGGIGRFFWGFMIDKYSFKNILIFLEFMVFLNGIIFPFVTNYVLYFFMIFFIAFFDGGLLSIMGPGLMNIYGLNIGAKLLPIKGLSFFLGLLICPIIGFLLEKQIGMEKVFFLLGFINIIGFGLSFLIKMKYRWYVSAQK